MPDDYDRADYLTPREVARLWGVTPDAVRKAIRRPVDPLPALKRPGGRYLIHKRHAALRPAGDPQDNTA